MTALQVLRSGTPEAAAALDRLTRRGETVLDPATLAGAAEILARVRGEGDTALLDLARRFDGAEADSVSGLALHPDAGELGGSLLPEGFVLPEGFAGALERAIHAVREFHEPQVRSGYVMESDGVELEERVTPLRRVGVYVPGGRASYPSTVVMTVVPAQVAGVQEIAVATPAGSYRSNPALRYTLARLGVREVWGIGGAHAVAALAYGTATIRRVDKIVGPGNAWVTAAKKLVVGDVAIDGIAGPSEVVIVAASGADPALLAADLLAQAEHDPLAAAVLLTPDEGLARAVAAEVEGQLAALATAETARESLRRFGLALVVQDFEEALGAVERIAPEHLQLVGGRAEALAGHVVAAGAIFVGADTPEVFGDYIAGPSHVLPTCGSARFASALGVEDFLRRSHRVRFTSAAARRDAGAAAVLARAEGLPAHEASARRRRG